MGDPFSALHVCAATCKAWPPARIAQQGEPHDPSYRPGLYDRADAHIELANQQIEKFEDLGKVSASLTFGAARFSAWMSARSFKSGAELGAAREEILKYSVISTG
jgi:peptide methionine sulfoxide reductase MsrA